MQRSLPVLVRLMSGGTRHMGNPDRSLALTAAVAVVAGALLKLGCDALGVPPVLGVAVSVAALVVGATVADAITHWGRSPWRWPPFDRRDPGSYDWLDGEQ